MARASGHRCVQNPPLITAELQALVDQVAAPLDQPRRPGRPGPGPPGDLPRPAQPLLPGLGAAGAGVGRRSVSPTVASPGVAGLGAGEPWCRLTRALMPEIRQGWPGPSAACLECLGRRPGRWEGDDRLDRKEFGWGIGKAGIDGSGCRLDLPCWPDGDQDAAVSVVPDDRTAPPTP